MKKILAFTLCFLMCLSLFSCEKGTDKMNEKTTDETTYASDKASTSKNNGVNKAPSTQTKPTLSKKELAMKAYIAVLNNERTLKYPLHNSKEFDEIYIKKIYNFGQYNNATQAIIDMDKDGIDEMIVVNNGKKVILHYENDLVYGFDFLYDAMQTLYADGSFSWRHYENNINEYGVSRISFVNGRLKFQELYRNENYHKFYVDGVEVTEEKYYEYIGQNQKTAIEFTPIDMSALNEGKAIELASKHWNIENGSFDEETGYRYRFDAYRDGEKYHVCLYWFVDNTYYENLKCVMVDITTGEISQSNTIHAKG
ncbi:MAG: hypothetical protein E7670_00755 [Ruminococcaceae bacterium]|nr:hypothetical protein [Oscillospiraceae bacterium]